MTDLRDHSQPCDHAPDDYTKVWGDGFHIGHDYQWAPAHGAWCAGGRVVEGEEVAAWLVDQVGVSKATEWIIYAGVEQFSDTG